jgi:hypothetical protein
MYIHTLASQRNISTTYAIFLQALKRTVWHLGKVNYEVIFYATIVNSVKFSEGADSMLLYNERIYLYRQ